MVKKNKYIYVVGPTGVGKSDLGVSIGESLNLPVFNADSLQVYKKLSIGTAKPTHDDMKGVAHYLFDYVDPPKTLTAADYVDDVVSLISEKKITNLVFVGGSGFYIQALEKGMFPNSETPLEVKKDVDQWVERSGIGDLYQWLNENDEESARVISPNDHYRIRRAVEVMKTQGKKLSQLKKEMATQNHSKLPEHSFIKVGLKMEKSLLRKRIELRTKKMLDSGLIQEVEGLLHEGLGDWAPMRSVGYRETVEYLNGKLSKEQMVERIVISTMQLIKKQMTWFKRDTSIHWYEVGRQGQAEDFVKEFFLS